MSKPRYSWWGYAKSMIRRYPDKVNEDERAAVEAAIEQTGRMANGRNRMKVVELALIKRTHQIPGAAMMVPCSERTAQQWHADFIKLVADNFQCKSLR